MFTGLVETTGTLIAAPPGQLIIAAGPLASGTAMGDSIAVNGCCLTVTEIRGDHLTFDVLDETRRRTNLQTTRPGQRVNLERALRADARLGGHFVTGHIEATGLIRKFAVVGSDFELIVAVSPAHTLYLVPKGCIAVDGISLTVAQVWPEAFSVWIIPHTRAVTALQERQVDDAVNLEFDLLAKYAEKILSHQTKPVNPVNPV
jgi:riboflavin synthase